MRKNVTRRQAIATAGAGITGALAGCLDVAGNFTGGDQVTVTIGGKQFTEQLLLSWMSSHMLEDAGFGVENSFPIGGNTANHEAITNGDVDHYWEYTGTGWNYHLGNTEEKIRDPQKLYQRTKETYQEEYGLTWLNTADFNNTYVVTANQQWKEETGVGNLSDIAEYINSGNEVRWAVSQEYLNNPTAFGNLPEFYGFEKNINNVNWVKMAIGTINYRAVANGDVDLGVGFTTNPNVEKFDLATINDDKNWFIIYYPAPVVQQDILTEDMRSVLNEPVSALDTKTIRSLNLKVSDDEGDPKDVARNWLEDQGML